MCQVFLWNSKVWKKLDLQRNDDDSSLSDFNGWRLPLRRSFSLPEKMNGKKYVKLSPREKKKCAERKRENGRRRKFVKFHHHNIRHIRGGKSWVDKGWISFQNLRKDENSVRFIRHEIKERIPNRQPRSLSRFDRKNLLGMTGPIIFWKESWTHGWFWKSYVMMLLESSPAYLNVGKIFSWKIS